MTYILDTVYFIRLDQVYYVFLSLDLVHNGHILMSAPVLRIQDVYPGSRILIFSHPGTRISDPGSRIPDPGSRIPDPKTATKERVEKKFVVISFYVTTNFTKL